MNTLPKVNIGVDISKKFLDIHLNPIEKSLKISNSPNGLKRFIKQLKKFEVGQVVCEASGGYERLALSTLKKAGFETWLADPNRIKSYARSEGIRAKTDKIDARVIAKFASEKKRPYKPIDLTDNQKQLQVLEKRKQELIEMISADKIRLGSPNEHHVKSIKVTLLFLEKQLDGVEKDMRNLVTQDPKLKKKMEIMTSMPSVGEGTATSLLATLPELGMLGPKPIAALAGVAPFTRQSGNYNGKAFTWGGRSPVKKALYMSSLSAIRFCPIRKAFYERLIGAGKAPKVALVAVMRKTLVILNAMLREEAEWNPNF